MLSWDRKETRSRQEDRMRTYLVVGIVVGAHCLAVGSVFLIQGCGTMMPPEDDVAMVEPAAVVMPPSAEPDPQPATVLVPPSAHTAPIGGDEPMGAQMVTYVVKKGDSLSGIAHRHGLSVAQVATLNGISNPNLIRAGQRLMLPSGKGRSAKPSATGTETAKRKKTGDSGNYVVKKGDSLSRIAFEHGTSVRALREANGLTGDMIMAGQELVIPGGATKRKASAPAMQPRKPVPEKPDVRMEERAPAIDSRVDEPERVDKVSAAPAGSSLMRTRVVNEGETIEEIAQQWGLSAEELRRVNNLGDDPVKPGDVLKIPLGEF